MAKGKNSDPQLDLETLANQFGWAMSVVNSDPELKHLFQQTVKHSWTQARFTAELRNTDWFRQHSDQWRQNNILRLSDPGTWKARLNQMRAHVKATYQSLNGSLPPQGLLDSVAKNALMYGWTDDQVHQHLSSQTNYVAQLKRDQLGGQAGQLQDQVQAYANSMGVRISNTWLGNRINDAMNGKTDQTVIEHSIRKMAQSQYRAFADEIGQGATVKDIAEPYMQMMAQTLELPEGSLDIHDAKIQHALTATDKDGKPKPLEMWQFQDQLRNDPRWDKTDNARQQMMDTANSILGQMGLVS